MQSWANHHGEMGTRAEPSGTNGIQHKSHRRWWTDPADAGRKWPLPPSLFLFMNSPFPSSYYSDFFLFFFVNYCSLCCWYISAVSGSHCSRRLLINGSFRLSVIYNYVASVTLTCAKVRWECGNFRPLSARLSLARHYPFPYYFQSSSRAVPEQFFSSD